MEVNETLRKTSEAAEKKFRKTTEEMEKRFARSMDAKMNSMPQKSECDSFARIIESLLADRSAPYRRGAHPVEIPKETPEDHRPLLDKVGNNHQYKKFVEAFEEYRKNGGKCTAEDLVHNAVKTVLRCGGWKEGTDIIETLKRI